MFCVRKLYAKGRDLINIATFHTWERQRLPTMAPLGAIRPYDYQSLNNLIASMLWHKLMDPPVMLIQEIQKRLVDFFMVSSVLVESCCLSSCSRRGTETDRYSS